MTNNTTVATTRKQQIQEFRDSVTPDLYEVGGYIDWADIEDRVARYQTAIDYLQQRVSESTLSEQSLLEGLVVQPNIYQVAMTLLAIPRGVGFLDGRELVDPVHLPTGDLRSVASLLMDIGLANLLPPFSNVQDLVRVAITAQDASRRRYRVGGSIESRLEQIVGKAIASISKSSIGIEEWPEFAWPAIARGKVDYVFGLDKRPRVAVAVVFQTASGGRQIRDLRTNFPNLQRDLAEAGLNLILIADGRGLREVADVVLDDLFSVIPNCMTFRQAARGGLEQALMSLVKLEPVTEEKRSLKSIILATILNQGEVSAKLLPGDPDRAYLALASFVDENPELDLVLDPTKQSIRWRRQQIVEMVIRLQSDYRPDVAINCLAMLLSSAPSRILQSADHSIEWSVLEIHADIVFPSRMTVAALTDFPDVDAAKAIAAKNLTETPESKLCLVIVPVAADETTSIALRKLQRTITANVIFINVNQLRVFSQSSNSVRSLIAKNLLEQSDLIKASPFVLGSVTPERMFYGRDVEEANMVSTLAANSVALLGGRRIGKTSLMRHVATRLVHGDFTPYFADCQTVRDWNDFSHMVSRAWGVEYQADFRPTKLFDLVNKLKARGTGKVIILLDEIDQLLDWDGRHDEGQVPEAFFRACRTISQEGLAQFVFSGERTIANRLWDPQSPHWNFCQPLLLRQLDPAASRRLILGPFEALQISIEDPDAFSSLAWSRTSGHPQLLQTLGDGLIRQLSEKAPNVRSSISSSSLAEVADTYRYADHFIQTYWGQATTLEKLLSLLVGRGVNTLDHCRRSLSEASIVLDDSLIRSALRMLELYGVIDSHQSGYRIRLDWLSTALAFYGSSDELVAQYINQINTNERFSYTRSRST